MFKLFLGNRQIPLSRLGVFWDFGSLHQHPDPVNGVMRTEEQNALFKQGLGCLGTLYSHPHTFVLRLTSFPDGHKAEDQAEGTNVAKYFDRGWCATENAWASLPKRRELSLDLGLMRDGEEYNYSSLTKGCIQSGGRRPPLLPSAFAAELEMKSFTSGCTRTPSRSSLARRPGWATTASAGATRRRRSWRRSSRAGQRRGSRRSISSTTRLATRAARRWPPPSRGGLPRA